VATAVAAISGVISELQRAAGALERLLELLYAESEITAPSNPVRFAGNPKGSLLINKVSFSYPSRPESLAIDNVSFLINPGENVALVGPSGAGKSTIFDLILRLYDVDQGTIQLEGIDIRDLDPVDLRRHIAIVSQQPAIFTGNVFDNIRYGQPMADRLAVDLAAESAYAKNFIEELPDKYDSFLGESGVRLSGGQKQRIAIARAILKDSEILLLDEATSALDAESERQVQNALADLMQNRTSLVIAHRLATVKNMDRIIVMDSGSVIAEGRHEDLLKQSTLYANLAKLQFSEKSHVSSD
jgi:ATP-binding cassette subfamily B protein